MQQCQVGEQFRLRRRIEREFADSHGLRQQRHLRVRVYRPDESDVEQQLRGFVGDEIAEDGRAQNVRDNVILMSAGRQRRPLDCHRLHL